VYFLHNFTCDGIQIFADEVGIVQGRTGTAYDILIVSLGRVVGLPRDDFEFFDLNEIGDAYPFKVCNVCQRRLPTSQFQRNQNGIGNRPVRRPSCNACRVIIDGVPVSLAERRRWERVEPRLVPFTCPVCQKTTIPGLTSKVVMDHDHKTGRVRAWICDSCNTGLGRFKDDVELLKNAIRYLETT
jgi:hypothetical protein